MNDRIKALRRIFFWVAIASGVLGVSLGVGLCAVFVYEVYWGDDSYLKKSTILAKINEETTIYYLDEQTRLGSFFEQQHRRYVSIDEIPTHMINAIIASEDKYFYDHHGINPIAISKAIMEGVQLLFTSGQMHFRGGSTITQQTVKNVLDRKEYSIRRKFREAIAAIQLERLYDKRQILEFYFNQFHVAANGNGIGIAAKYYFNKDVRDLSLVEAAFIAGSVKGPSKYNPFIQYTPEAKKQAWNFANERKNYVLKQMFEQSWINEQEYKEAVTKPVPFNKGRFTTQEVALVSLIRGQLDRREILDAIGVENIDELSHAGLKIISTLDYELQTSAQLMMRRNLSRLEVILQGYKPEAANLYRPLRDLEVGEFYFGKVEKIVMNQGQPEVQIDFGLPKGTIPYESLVRYSKLMDIAIPQGSTQRLKELTSSIKPGHVVFVEVRSYDRETHQAVLELQRRPVINGAMVALDRGEMRAVVSGFDSQGYNRAIFGKRQPGSVFKSVSYFAALQLGWSILDQLDNERRLYPYQGQFYYPRPDHDSPYNDVSMIWAGTKSENLASIFLTSRLVEKLNLKQFKAVMGLLELLPEDGENKRDFHYRVARKIGVQLDNEGVREYELQNAVNDVSADLVFAGQNDTMRQIQKMWWGRGYAAELQRLLHSRDDDLGEREKTLRIALVKNNFQRHAALAAQLETDWNEIVKFVGQSSPEALLNDAHMRQLLLRFRVIPGRANRPALGYFYSPPEELGKTPGVATIMVDPAPGRMLNALDLQAIWGTGIVNAITSNANISLDDVRIAGYLPFGVLKKLRARLDERYDAVMAIQEPYDLPQYFHHHDFRIAIGLTYLKKLCEQMGVFSQIEPVLSFPLGTNVVSVAEVAKVYQTFAEGKIHRFYREGPANQINFIKRIEDREGNILYEPKRESHQLVDPRYADEMQQILRKVVTHGTGGRARGELYVKVPQGDDPNKFLPIRVPAFGKTGTTNDYTTASFAGLLPYPTAKKAPLDPKDSYVLAAYVGYDFNKEMIRGGFKVSGSQGALPVWTDFAKEIIEHKKYVDSVDQLDLKLISRQEWPLNFDKNTQVVKVDLARGMMLRQEDSVESEVFATTDIGVTGEEFVNEFALNASIKSTVRIAVESVEGVTGPARAVIPLNEFKTEEQIENDAKKHHPVVDTSTATFSTKVETDNATVMPNQSNVSAGASIPTPPQTTQAPVSGASPTAAASSTVPPSGVVPSTDDLLKQIESQQEQQKTGNPTGKPNPTQNINKPGDPGYTENQLW